MPFELISRTYLTPQRLFSLLQVVQVCESPTRRQILDLLQPSTLRTQNESQETSERLLSAARTLKLVTVDDSAGACITLAISEDILGAWDRFRKYMQSILLNTLDESQDHFLLNQIAAWYAVQDEKILRFSKRDVERRFNEQLYPSATTVRVSEDPMLTAWLRWADFLGWCWTATFAGSNELQFVPDATIRIQSVLHSLLPSANETLLRQFMDRVAGLCPELDGGVLYEQCWQASRSGEPRGNRLSLMLSTALRVLHSDGVIELLDRPDAAENWTLFPAQSHMNRVTHIRRKGAI